MRKFTSIQALIGFIMWLSFFLALEVNQIERLLLFAMLVIVPLILNVIETRNRNGDTFKTYIFSVYLYPIAALLACLSFFFSTGITAGLLSLGWLIWTAMVFLYGVSRLLARGLYLIEEVSIDIGLMYLLLGGAWFSTFQFGINVMSFGPTITLLTAIHFHFSALITPIFIGFVGRLLRQRGEKLPVMYHIAAIGIMVSSMGIAVGITFSRLVEFVFVVVFVICLWLYAYFTVVRIRTLTKSTIAYVFLVLSSGTLLLTMLLAGYYGLSRVLHVELISIPNMVSLHGIGNAFGFVFLGVIGWSFIRPSMVFNPYAMPTSNLFGRWKIGADFFQQYESKDRRHNHYEGLVDNLGEFQQRGFDAQSVHPTVRHFYEQTLEYELHSKTYWHKGFGFLSRIYKQFSSSIEQINLPLNHETEELVVDSRIVGISSKQDGRQKVRAWIRTSRETNKAVFVAAYSSHEYQEKKYLNIALPLPSGQMTGVLRFENPQDKQRERGFILTSLKQSADKGDEGIYYVTKWFTIRLPINEHFTVWPETGLHQIKASHKMWIFGIPFLSIDYTIKKREGLA